MNTPRERAIRVVEAEIRKAQEQVNDMQFLLSVLQDVHGMDKEYDPAEKE